MLLGPLALAIGLGAVSLGLCLRRLGPCLGSLGVQLLTLIDAGLHRHPPGDEHRGDRHSDEDRSEHSSKDRDAGVSAGPCKYRSGAPTRRARIGSSSRNRRRSSASASAEA